MRTVSGNSVPYMAAKQLASDIKMGLEAPLRLKREAALSRLAKQLNNDSASEEGGAFRDAMCCEVLQLLADSQWQPRLGGLDAAQACPARQIPL